MEFDAILIEHVVSSKVLKRPNIYLAWNLKGDPVNSEAILPIPLQSQPVAFEVSDKALI